MRHEIDIETGCAEAGCSCQAHADGLADGLVEAFPLPRTGKDMKILIVDDAHNMLVLLTEYLEGFGYSEILTAASSNEAFEHLTADPEVPASDAVDLILLDIVMPGLDGIDACRRIKGDMGCGDVPVIMVTGEAGMDHLRQAFDAGATDYVTKPFKRLDLRVRVASALKLKQAMDAQKRTNALLEEKNVALIEAIENVKVLRGLLPICASCKKIRNDSGSWSQIEAFISANSEAVFSHGICPGCQEELYPEVYRRLKQKGVLPS